MKEDQDLPAALRDVVSRTDCGALSHLDRDTLSEAADCIEQLCDDVVAARRACDHVNQQLVKERDEARDAYMGTVDPTKRTWADGMEDAARLVEVLPRILNWSPDACGSSDLISAEIRKCISSAAPESDA